MMTTGYDCPDILNQSIFRPIFSPIGLHPDQGPRHGWKLNFLYLLFDDERTGMVAAPYKTSFKQFDFFGNCEYFE